MIISPRKEDSNEYGSISRVQGDPRRIQNVKLVPNTEKKDVPSHSPPSHVCCFKFTSLNLGILFRGNVSISECLSRFFSGFGGPSHWIYPPQNPPGCVVKAWAWKWVGEVKTVEVGIPICCLRCLHPYTSTSSLMFFFFPRFFSRYIPGIPGFGSCRYFPKEIPTHPITPHLHTKRRQNFTLGAESKQGVRNAEAKVLLFLGGFF